MLNLFCACNNDFKKSIKGIITTTSLFSNIMPFNVDTSTLSQFNPFPRNSVNLLSGPTSSGKTYFVSRLLENYRVYFQGPVDRIVVVLCNDRIQHLTLNINSHQQEEEEEEESTDQPVVLQIPLANFDPDQLQENDLVVIDDLQALTEVIRLTISVCAHHYNLASLFIITHSLLGNRQHFELLSLCHRIFLFLKGTSNIRLFKYLNSNFYQDPDIQQALKDIVPFCQRNNQVLALELNPLASNSTDTKRINVLGFSHLPTLLTSGYFLIYTTSHLAMEYDEHTNHFRVDSDLASDFVMAENNAQLPKYSLVVVPASSIISSHKPKEDANVQCSAQQQWSETLEEIEELIESNFKPSRWKDIKSLAREILKNKNWCVYTDGRYFQVKGKPKTKVPLLDFLGEVTKQVFGREQVEKPEYKKFRPYVRELRARGVSSTLLKNKNI